MDLFKRRPRFRPLPKEPGQLIQHQDRYPALAADFKILDDILIPTFNRFDREAIRLQNAHWWTYVILIAGGALATILGILQLAISVPGIGISGAIVAAFLGCSTLALNSFRYQERYMNNRLAAEALRGEYFRFLGQIGNYTRENSERVVALKEYVTTVKDRLEM